MPANPQTKIYRNRLLSGLDEHDINLIGPHLQPVDLRRRQRLEAFNKPIDTVYFVDHGMVSVVAHCRPGVPEAGYERLLSLR